jgi:squalene synthase HpnC
MIQSMFEKSVDAAIVPTARSITTPILDAYKYCEELTRNHYENFPVASLFMPRDYRRYICSIYAFARIADDFADEGTLSPAERLQNLDDWEENLDKCFDGRPEGPVFTALAETVTQFGIPKVPFTRLLKAFRMDVTQKRFESFEQLRYYCEYSANPIGELVLYVFKCATGRTVSLSDKICTGLQLTNFWQDVSVDWRKGRIYLPLEDFRRFSYTEADLTHHIADERFCQLVEFEVSRSKTLFEEGKPLLDEVVSDLRFELALTWHGGMTILNKIEDVGYNVLKKRPTISSIDKLILLSKAMFHRFA